MDDATEARVMSCANCQGPVMQDAPVCKACNSPVTGKEFPYIAQQPATADIPGLVRWWGIWCLAIWALAGFSLGVTSSLVFTGVSLVYLVRILRAYFS